MSSENSADHYADGVDLKGRPARVSLRFTDAERAHQRRDKKVLPDLRLFADERRSAKRPCLASPENSKENPRGILLMERCRVEDACKRVYSAGWASVLRVDEEAPLPLIGQGFMAMLCGPIEDEASHLLDEYDLAKEEIRRNAICAEICARRTKRFSAIYPIYKACKTPSDEEGVENAVLTAIRKLTRKGIHGGAMLRVRRGRQASANLSKILFPRYKKELGRVETPEEAWESSSWMRHVGRKALMKSLEIDVIPMRKVNAGPHGNKHFSEAAETPDGVPKVEKVWMEEPWRRNPHVTPRDWPWVLTPLATRLAPTTNGESMLLSTAHAFGMPWANALEVGKDLKRTCEVVRRDDCRHRSARETPTP